MRNEYIFLALGLLAPDVRAELISRAVTQWLWPSSLVVGDHLYVTGGEQYNTSQSWTGDAGTWIVDLTQSWTNETIVPVGGQMIANPSQMVPSRQPLLFYDSKHNTVNRWAGWPYEGHDYPTTLWSFTGGSTAADWQNQGNVSGDASAGVSNGPFASAIAYSNDTFFCWGGNIQSSDSPNMTVLSGLVMQDFATETWSNDTSVLYAQTEFRTEARAAFAPNFGSKGYFIAVGGEAPATEVSVYEEGNAMADMSEIILHDIASGAWYQQQATGDIPPPRSEFCAVGAASVNNTFELFVYGGSVNSTDNQNKINDDGYLSVYALSIPAFRWFKSDSSTTRRRASQACSVIGNRQMISIGGQLVASSFYEQDPWTSSIGVFDMTEFAWADHYDPGATAYESPDVVKEYYASQYSVPTWADSTLASVFAYHPSQNSSTSSSSSSNSASSSTPVGAIVGGVVGGVAAIAILGGALFWWMRRRRQRAIPTQNIYPDDGKGAYTDVESAAPMHEVEGSVHKMAVAPTELSSNPDAIAELPGHEGDTGHDREMSPGRLQK